jgi:DNA primase catalytic core
VARLPDEVVERIKREISVERLVEARGIQLKRVGKNLVGLCPFHKEQKPSLTITPSTNKWRCFGCGKGGTAIDWVMHTEGVSVSHALQLLRRDLVPTASAGQPPKLSTVPKLPPLIPPTNDDKRLLEIVVSYYHETLKQSPEAQQYLVKRGLQSAEMVEQFRLGYANRTLGYYLPKSNRVAGAAQRGRLKELGVLRNQTPGHEHFNGSLVIPIFNLQGEVMQMYGRKIRDDLREGTPDHLYLPGPLRGVWNEQALIGSKDIILCEALIDALTFWCAGYRNVTTIYGVNNFTDELRAAFQQHGTKRIYLAYDRDDAGERAVQIHSEELMEMGIECFRMQFPRGQDANEFALKNQPAAKFLGMYLTSAAWMGKGKRPSTAVMKPTPPSEEEQKPEPMKKQEPSAPSAAVPLPEERPKPAAKEKIAIETPTPSTGGKRVFPLAADSENVPHEEAVPRPMPLAAPAAPQVEIDGEEIVVSIGQRTYRVLGLEKCTSRGKMHVNVKASGQNVRGEYCYHGDTLDMESFQRRAAFIKQAAHELATKEETIHREVGQLWTVLADLQRETLKKALATPEEKSLMTAEEEAAAMELLHDPRLLDRVLADFEKCGAVGEETNKKVSYLAGVSRLLPKPLAIVVQSSSSAGKSSLMEAVLDFMPEEQRESYTAMTGQALFYMGQKNLKHKILAIAEQQGAEAASYPLKLLQSEGKLNIASTGKDPVSGKHVTHEYVVEGPVMIFLTTTAHEVDEELLNRCIVLTVNEDREQTRAIHRKQRESQTLEGLKARMRQNKIIRLHRNAQRLLRPIQVVIEHLKDHSFPDAMTRTRRDHMKFLTLIQAVTLMHQHQREIKTSTEDGETLEYIEATEADVKLAWELTNHVLVRSLDDVPPQTRRLLLLIDKMVIEECKRLEIERLDYRFTRATVRRFTGWGDSQLKKHLSRLEDLEYLALHRGAPGQSFVYALNFEMDENGRPVLPGLSYGANRSRFAEGVSHLEAGVTPSSHGQVTGVSRGGHDAKSPAMKRVENGFSEKSRKNTSSEAALPENLPDPIVVAGKTNGANGHAHAAVK